MIFRLKKMSALLFLCTVGHVKLTAGAFVSENCLSNERVDVVNMSDYKLRRDRFIKAVSEKYQTTQGVILVAAAFEQTRHRYRQDSYFYYLTGITEPGAMLMLGLDGSSRLYLPNFGKEREKWVTLAIHVGSDPAAVGLTEIKYLSQPLRGYSAEPFFDAAHYQGLLDDLQQLAEKGYLFAAVFPQSSAGSDQHHLFVALGKSLLAMLPGKNNELYDVSAQLDRLRRFKDAGEVALIQHAIDITIKAQAAAAEAIRPGAQECGVQAEIEKTFIQNEAFFPSFPSIVAGGKNTTVLHYTDNTATLQAGDLCVIDIGAEYGLYAADLTRTYPVSGRYSPRQKEIYQHVLDAQAYIASIAKPGMFLRNTKAQDKSLHYQTVEFFKKLGLEQYFPHGLGHYMGLDVHDVGAWDEPLQPGDVFTIEPGLYLPDEAIGVRIEDDYLMTEQGAVCLSAALPKEIEDIERLMASR